MFCNIVYPSYIGPFFQPQSLLKSLYFYCKKYATVIGSFYKTLYHNPRVLLLLQEGSKLIWINFRQTYSLSRRLLNDWKKDPTRTEPLFHTQNPKQQNVFWPQQGSRVIWTLLPCTKMLFKRIQHWYGSFFQA